MRVMARAADVVLRAAVSVDDDALAELDRRCWALEHEVSDGPAKPGESFFTEHSPPTDHVVAELDGAVVGYVRLAPPTPLPSNAHVQQLRGLVVAPEVRGQGIGRALVEAAIQLAGQRCARKVSLRVLGTNPGAQRLYASAGFEVEGVLRGEFDRGGRDVDDVLMARRLD